MDSVTELVWFIYMIYKPLLVLLSHNQEYHLQVINELIWYQEKHSSQGSQGILKMLLDLGSNMVQG